MDALAPKVMPERLRRGMHQHDPDANVVPPDSGHDVLGAAWALTPELSERAAEGEARRTMPPDLVEKLRTAGLFDMGRPRSLGGLELDPLTQMQVIEQLSRADGSAGWTVMIGDSSMFFAWLDPEVAREMIGNDTQFASSSTAAPLGRRRTQRHRELHRERTVALCQRLPSRHLVSAGDVRHERQQPADGAGSRPGLAVGVLPVHRGRDP
jgi:hypothetical protein